MHKKDLELNKLQVLISCKTQSINKIGQENQNKENCCMENQNDLFFYVSRHQNVNKFIANNESSSKGDKHVNLCRAYRRLI